jgi:hypothetical protein
VKAFMPGRSGRLVAGEGLVRGLGLGLLERAAEFTPRVWKLVFRAARSAGPLKLWVSGSWLAVEVLDRWEVLLLLRCKFLRMEPNNERPGWFSSAGVTVHCKILVLPCEVSRKEPTGLPVGMTGDVECGIRDESKL